MTEPSLTLPKATTRKRTRRRKMPRPSSAIVLMIAWALCAILAAVAGRIVFFGICAASCGAQWLRWKIELAGGRVSDALLLTILALAAAAVAFSFAGLF